MEWIRIATVFKTAHHTLARNMSWKTGKKLIHYITFRTLNKVTLVLCRVGRKSLEARIREIFFLPQRHAISYNLISRRDIFSHYAWPIFMILCWIGSKFPFKKFPFLSQFCTLLYQRVFRVFNLRRIFSMKVLFFYTKKKLDTIPDKFHRL